MHALALAAFSLFVASADPTPVADAPIDPAVSRLISAHDAAWNKHDAKALASLFTGDATVVTPAGRRAVGDAAILAMFAEPGPTKKSTSSTRVVAVQKIADDLVLVDAVQSLQGMPEGPAEATLIAVLRRGADGGWRFVSARPVAKR